MFSPLDNMPHYVLLLRLLLLPDFYKLNECHYYALKTLREACDNEEHM